MKHKVSLTSLALMAIFSANCYADCNNGSCNYRGGYDSNQGGYNQGYYNQGQNDRGYYNNQGQQQDRGYNNRGQQDRQSQGYYNNNGQNDRQGYYNNQSQQDRHQGQGYNNNQNSQYANRQDDNNNGYDSNNSYYNRQNNDDQVRGSDADISKKINDTVSSGWMSKGYPNVSFDVNNGNVILKGTVKSLDDRTKLEDTVRKIDGVKNIDNRITVVADKSTAYLGPLNLANNDSKIRSAEEDYPQDVAATDSDRLLNSQIRNKFSGWFTTDYKTLTISTNNGVVTITGTVDSADDLKKINDKVKDISGVKTLNNRVTVRNR